MGLETVVKRFRILLPAAALAAAVLAFAPGGARADAATGAAFDAAKVLASVVTVETYESQGSGLVVDAAGHVLTNAHVLDGQKSCTIYRGAETATGRAVLVDEDLDLAVLSTDLAAPAPCDFADTEDLAVGMDVFVAGSPEGLPETVTRGILSVVGQPYYGMAYLQTDAPVTYGNSGGPLCGADGKVLGLVTFTIGEGESLAFAIPNDALLGFLHRAGILEDRTVSPVGSIEGIPGYYDGTYEWEDEPPTEALPEGGVLSDPRVAAALAVLAVAEGLVIAVLLAVVAVLLVRAASPKKRA